MKMLLIKRESPEWDYMWEWLANHPLNEGLAEPTVAFDADSGEAWQYMGSWFDGKDYSSTIHQFRHRCHPSNQKREYLPCKCSPDMKVGDIEKEIKIS